MNAKKILSDEEFSKMLSLMARFVETELDQFESWKIDVKGHPIYIDISIGPAAVGAEGAYRDLSHLLKDKE